MPSTYFDQWSQSNKNTLAPLLELNGIATKMCGEIIRENLKTMNEIMQTGAEGMQEISHANGLPAVFSANSRCVAKLAPKMMEHTQHVLDTMMEGANAYQKWLEKGVEQFQEQGKAMTEKMAEKMTFKERSKERSERV
ncbi:MAG: phasin family protein [Candidatus Berkiellales bacterium]